MKFRRRFLISLLALTAHAAIPDTDTDLPSSQLLIKANSLLSSGSILNAIEYFDLVLDRDHSDYLTLYKRATAYLGARQQKRALEDLEAVLRLTEFDQARLQIVKLRLQSGDVKSAKAALQPYLDANPKDATGLELKQSINKLKGLMSEAKHLKQTLHWQEALDLLQQAVKIAPSSSDILEMISDCLLATGHLTDATGELSRAASHFPSSTSILTRLTLLNYIFLSSDSAVALQPIKQCLRFDPDSKSCKGLFKTLKKLDKEIIKARNFIEGERWASASITLDSSKADSPSIIATVKSLIHEHVKLGNLPHLTKIEQQSQLLEQLYSWTCQAQVKSKSKSASLSCAQLLNFNPEAFWGLMGKGQDALNNQDYEAAVRIFGDAFEKSGKQDRDALEQLQKAQQLLKRSKSKDYYKVLGVSPEADDRTIKKAYRKATLKAHPDKGGSEAKMAAVNEAYEVLSNPELRSRFDRGDDPNDTSNQGAYQQPFHFQGGFPFGNGGGMPGNVFQQFFQQGGQQGGGRSFHFTYG